MHNNKWKSPQQGLLELLDSEFLGCSEMAAEGLTPRIERRMRMNVLLQDLKGRCLCLSKKGYGLFFENGERGRALALAGY